MSLGEAAVQHGRRAVPLFDVAVVEAVAGGAGSSDAAVLQEVQAWGG